MRDDMLSCVCRRADIEDRVFELLGDRMASDELLEQVVDEYGVSWNEAVAIARKVVSERGTPNLAVARRHIRRLGATRVY
jgi:hypothetical protein